MTNNTDIQLDRKISYEEAFALVKQEVESNLVKSPLLIREYLKHLSLSQGKFIRAVSVLACAVDSEGKIHQDAVHAAAAIEILHLASLVHDDVIDNADLRRGKPTLQKKYGQRTAVICGDYLLSLALRNLSAISTKKDYMDMDFHDYVGKLCLGELNQHINNGNKNLTVFQYLKIISGKTAALFEASFHAGAVFCGCEEKQAREYRQLGYYVGMIFQLSDDCIDFDSTVEEANKPVQSDYEQGVITLPLIHALEKLTGFKKKAADGEVSREEINEAVAKAEGLSYTRMVIGRYYKKSLRRLEELDLSGEKRERLLAILNKAARMPA